MHVRSWALTEDLSMATLVAVGVVAVLALVLLAVELRERERLGALIFGSGALGTLLCALAVMRPVRVSTRGSMVGPRVVVLVDQSRRLLLPAEGTTRRALALRAAQNVVRRYKAARLSVLGFGEGAPTPLALDAAGTKSAVPQRLSVDSDLSAALSSLASSPGERPEAVVVVSDGRLTRPASGADASALKRAVGALGVPVHTVRVVERAPQDASIRAVRAAGAAVAHQPLALTVEVGCSGGLTCGRIPITVRELRRGVAPAVLASGEADVKNGTATVELHITLERAGARVIEVSIDAPPGDTIPENNRRFVTFSVTRDRIRVLHIAGRPTYDVRALRMWLKSDQAVDLVSFFILRTDQNDTGTTDDSELALIPFPVDQLFTEYLPTFDAVVLQDFDAVRYRLSGYLPELARYVEAGGGLIMVGGPSEFIGGGYADTALDQVLPVELPPSAKPFDTAPFVPEYTEAGREAPMLASLRELYGDELPEMPGENTLGAARPGALVLWQHPTLKAGGAPMPVLALGEEGDGRTIALGVDGTHLLAFSEMAAKAAGRGYAALWGGLLGWLMRDPRYEAAKMELKDDCFTGEPTTIVLTRLPGMNGDISFKLERLGKNAGKPIKRTVHAPPPGPLEISVGDLEPGGYTAEARIGAAPATRFDFSCEKGGQAWSDSRPDPRRLERIAEVTDGLSVRADAVDDLPEPRATRIAAERHVRPLLPPWIWTLAAALALGVHWVARRRGGLA
jgi:uncharacterized membrane protein